MVSILSEPMPPPSKLSPALATAFDPWFFRSCHRDSASRWPNTSSQAEALNLALGRPLPEPLGASVRGPASPEPRPQAGPTRVARRRSLVEKWNWMIAFATLVILGAMWRMRTYADEHWQILGKNDAGIEAEPAIARPVLPPEGVTSSAPVAPAVEPPASSPPRTGVAEGARPRANGPARPARPAMSAGEDRPLTRPSAAPTPTPSLPGARRPSGASCSRSSECASGLCLAETCQ
jgi:hypothetical protein